MRDFTIYPAIDLRAGKVVRLLRGDPSSQTTYGDNPAKTARRWLAYGATWLHVINLDGAFSEPDLNNLAALKDIVNAVKSTSAAAQIQFGGGLRSLDTIENALSTGISRVILGTVAIEKTNLLENALRTFGNHCIVLAIDAKDNQVAVRGWTKRTAIDPISLGDQFYKMGLRTAIYTNINLDGSGEGVDIAASKEIASATGLSIIASGGVATLEDVRLVQQAGLAGVIIGRALYDGTINLQEALTC
ncbi:MAG: 1-(5-phosphoribosyl)-5-[(5-phosphoribosylamino)methylideneamino]imidazole-4-carboxamide isomerase [Anaerolineales bacterium]|nr:1-(5-phosphoribosyl)-5-[(5-phosphoribosylamino)methylideneamino]imidazole-4-carboxamide isomerase [Anaerolineales bacterium]